MGYSPKIEVCVMTDKCGTAWQGFSDTEIAPDLPASGLRIISWNLLRLVGAGVGDVARLIREHRPDLLVMQEATKDLAELTGLVGGHFYREPLHGRVYGLAVWSPHHIPRPKALALPVSTMPGRVPPRLAQIIRFGGATFANVHLSHGQFLNRWQLLHIARTLDGAAAIIGDYNAVGPIKLPGFKDLGPRQPTHSPTNVISFRLDRCMARGLQCTATRVLQRGPSDHHPIFLELRVHADEELPTRPERRVQRRAEHLIGKVSRLSGSVRRHA
jgi:endonuclease/exonuclease/phosphatase family metal-dependent hydrolase